MVSVAESIHSYKLIIEYSSQPFFPVHIGTPWYHRGTCKPSLWILSLTLYTCDRKLQENSKNSLRPVSRKTKPEIQSACFRVGDRRERTERARARTLWTLVALRFAEAFGKPSRPLLPLSLVSVSPLRALSLLSFSPDLSSSARSLSLTKKKRTRDQSWRTHKAHKLRWRTRRGHGKAKSSWRVCSPNRCESCLTG